MSDKVRVDSAGDTNLLPGELVERYLFEDENAACLAKGGEPATAQVTVLGITRAALYTDSWLSAASFQETSNILTNAATTGKDIVRKSAAFEKQWGPAYAQASSELKQRRDRLERRLRAFEDEGAPRDRLQALEEELRLDEWLLKGVAEPYIRLESIGFFVLAKNLPLEA